MVSLLLFAVLFFCLAITVPVSVCLAFSAMVGAVMSGVVNPQYLATSLFTAIDSFPLMAVPLFILAGDLMSKVGISDRLLNAANIFVGRYPGGLGLVTVLCCMFFASISGSGPATVVAIGSIVVPAMLAKGYSREFAAGLVATAGGIGIIIPPSIPMVFFGVNTETSISALFTAGFIPGILIGIGLMVLVLVMAKRHGYTGDPRIFTTGEKLAILWDSAGALIMPVIILGGIYGGIFTPTEAAGVAVVYAYFVGFVWYRTLTVKKLVESLVSAAGATTAALIIAGTAMSFARVLTVEKIPELVADTVLSISSSQLGVLLIINIFLLFVGCFIDTVSAVIILAPILMPIAAKVGVHPVHFGLIMVVNLAIGFITPPLGVNLFMVCGIAKIGLEKASLAVLPWLAVMLACLILITYVPWFTMFLPNLFGVK